MTIKNRYIVNVCDRLAKRGFLTCVTPNHTYKYDVVLVRPQERLLWNGINKYIFPARMSAVEIERRINEAISLLQRIEKQTA